VIQLSQKCHYAIRAVLELARRGVGQSATIGEIARPRPSGWLSRCDPGELSGQASFSHAAACAGVSIATGPTDSRCGCDCRGGRSGLADGRSPHDEASGRYVWGDGAVGGSVNTRRNVSGDLCRDQLRDLIEREA